MKGENARAQSKSGADVLMVSLKAAALGLNLTAANHVVLLDLWWNPTVEEQAIDRAHRIGQTRAVHVTRITIEGAQPSPSHTLGGIGGSVLFCAMQLCFAKMP